MKQFHVYIMASDSGTIYVGFSDNLIRRVWEHKNDVVEWFTRKYQCHKLVYFEDCNDPITGLEREIQLKKWRREKKENLIKTKNPTWKDLYPEIIQ